MGSPLRHLNRLALDTNVFIYQFEDRAGFKNKTEHLFDHISKYSATASTSVLSLVELLALPIHADRVEFLKGVFFQTPNLIVLDVDREIALEAANIRRKYGFHLPDAIQLATASTAKAQAFITNDKQLMRYQDCRVILLSDL